MATGRTQLSLGDRVDFSPASTDGQVAAMAGLKQPQVCRSSPALALGETHKRDIRAGIKESLRAKEARGESRHLIV